MGMSHADDEGEGGDGQDGNNDTADQGDATQGGEGQASQGRRKKRGQGAEVNPSCTLEHPDKLRDKRPEATFDSDPLFSKTSKLFDENSAAGACVLQM